MKKLAEFFKEAKKFAKKMLTYTCLSSQELESNAVHINIKEQQQSHQRKLPSTSTSIKRVLTSMISLKSHFAKFSKYISKNVCMYACALGESA